MSYDNASIDALLSDLQASVEACALIRSFTTDTDLITGLAQSDVASLEFVEKPPSVSDVVETTRSLFEDCQEGRCASADITLALQGTADSERVLQKVHRCILSARCPFFQALFSELWTEKSAATIEVATEECSGSQAVTVIEYLYTGSISADAGTAAEVASLANLWQLPGLINVIINQLIQDPCNSFKRPSGASDETLTSIPQMASFAAAAVDAGIEHGSLSSLFESCVAWMARHALLVWPTKAFAQLPDPIVSATRAKAKSMLNAVNSLPQLEQAVKLIARVPQAKWAIDLHKIAKVWRAEVLQYIADNFPAIILTSAFVERLQSSWSLENLQEIAAAVKLEYGASRAGYALEVYLALQRLQTAAAGEAVVEAEDVQTLLDDLKDHCWKYILRNWHFLQRTPTFKSTLPVDARQRLSAEVKDSLVSIASLESPGDKAQSTGFSVLWDASNMQDDSAGANALGPDGKRPVSKATEKRRQRLLEQQKQQQQQQEQQKIRARSAKLGQPKGSIANSGSAGAARPRTAQSSAPQSDVASNAHLRRRATEAPDATRQAHASSSRAQSGSARQPTNATEQTGSSSRSAAGTATRAARPSSGAAAAAAPTQVQTAKLQSGLNAGSPGLGARAQVTDRQARQTSRRQAATDLAAAQPSLPRVSSQTQGTRPMSLIPRRGLSKPASTASQATASPVPGAVAHGSLHDNQAVNAARVSADVAAEHSQAQQALELQQPHENNAQSPVRSLSQLQQLRRLSLASQPRFR